MDEQMKRKYNLKLYAIYKMFSWDLLFYFAIILLFLNQTKGFSIPSILFADAFYPLFKVIFQLVCVGIIDYIGKRRALLIGNLFVSASILILILGNNISDVFISNLIMAMGFVLKELCEPNILNISIPDTKSKPDIFSKIDSKGSTAYYFLDAISSLTTGFLFVINGYLPMIFCFAFCLISTLLSYNFNEIKVSDQKPNSFKQHSGFKALKLYFKDLKNSFRYIFHSRRLKALLLFSALFSALLSLFPTLRSTLLLDLEVPKQYFGIIVAIGQITSGISTKKHAWFHKTFKNRTLTWFAFPIVFSLIFSGIAVVCNLNIYIIGIVVGIMIIFISIIKGPYATLIKRYFNSFSTPTLSTKIYAAKSIVDSLMRILVFLLASFLFEITNTSYSLIILGCLLTLIFIFLLDYMKSRVGLKPEEYDKKDIEFKILN